MAEKKQNQKKVQELVKMLTWTHERPETSNLCLEACQMCLNESHCEKTNK